MTNAAELWMGLYTRYWNNKKVGKKKPPKWWPFFTALI